MIEIYPEGLTELMSDDEIEQEDDDFIQNFEEHQHDCTFETEGFCNDCERYKDLKSRTIR